jgi:hypothetical protein
MMFVPFLCLPKEKEPKERAPVAFGPADCPPLLEEAGILQTRFAQTVQNPFRQLLRCFGKCQWEQQRCRVAAFLFQQNGGKR